MQLCLNPLLGASILEPSGVAKHLNQEAFLYCRGLVQIVKSMIRSKYQVEPEPRYEIEPETYYKEFLTEKDSSCLKSFVEEFGKRLNIPSAILAVGSTTFPKNYWDDTKKLNLEDPTLNAHKTYRDIDLLIVPEEGTNLKKIESDIRRTLKQMKYKFKEDNMTFSRRLCDGCSIGEDGKANKTIVPWLDIDYSSHSIETKLGSGTKLELIFGRDDILLKTASEKIAEERKENYAFSLLYRRS